MRAHAQRPRYQDNIQAHHQTHRLRKSMGKESARGESRRDLNPKSKNDLCIGCRSGLLRSQTVSVLLSGTNF
jgi:hypothetical protein